jgi:hypothetical protein
MSETEGPFLTGSRPTIADIAVYGDVGQARAAHSHDRKNMIFFVLCTSLSDMLGMTAHSYLFTLSSNN